MNNFNESYRWQCEIKFNGMNFILKRRKKQIHSIEIETYKREREREREKQRYIVHAIFSCENNESINHLNKLILLHNSWAIAACIHQLRFEFVILLLLLSLLLHLRLRRFFSAHSPIFLGIVCEFLFYWSLALSCLALQFWAYGVMHRLHLNFHRMGFKIGFIQNESAIKILLPLFNAQHIHSVRTVQ